MYAQGAQVLCCSGKRELIDFSRHTHTQTRYDFHDCLADDYHQWRSAFWLEFTARVTCCFTCPVQFGAVRSRSVLFFDSSHFLLGNFSCLPHEMRPSLRNRTSPTPTSTAAAAATDNNVGLGLSEEAIPLDEACGGQK